MNLRDRDGNSVSDNFYWRTAKDATDLAQLDGLPPVRLDASCEVRREGSEWVAECAWRIGPDSVAFFAHLVLTKGPRGEEILPVLWDDNYFSLAPGESRQVSAGWRPRTWARRSPPWRSAAGTSRPTTAAWRCRSRKGPVKAGQPVTVSATIADTFLGGSRVTLLVDGQPAGSQWAWARGEKSARVSFEVSLPGRGSTRWPSAGRHSTWTRNSRTDGSYERHPGTIVGRGGRALNGTFALPLKGTKRWAWENTWLVYSAVGMVAAGWAVACTPCRTWRLSMPPPVWP